MTAPGGGRPETVELRPVRDEDLDALYRHQDDPAANALAGVPPRNHVAFTEHWSWLREDETVTTRAIEADGELAGYLLSWPDGDRRMCGYWLGREFWGRGIAGRAFRQYLRLDTHRPLYALVSPGNAASVRILEANGFVPAEAAQGAEIGTGVPVLEYVLR
jgi:RimJ/RimL family protein N-acetyltransferase